MHSNWIWVFFPAHFKLSEFMAALTLPLLVFICWSLLFLFSLSDVSGNEKTTSDNITRILDRLLDGYDNRLRPGSGGDSALWPQSLTCKDYIQSDFCRWCHRGENRHLRHQLWTRFRRWDGEIVALSGDDCMTVTVGDNSGDNLPYGQSAMRPSNEL